VEKMAMWNYIPLKVVGVFYCYFCRDPATLARCKVILGESICEYDDALLRGKTLHRVATRLLDPSTLCGEQLRAFHAQEEKTLFDYAHAFVELMCYAFVSLVERRVEMIHALIKRVGRLATRITPQYVCAAVREPMHLKLLQSSREFSEECVRLWRKSSLFGATLLFRAVAVHEQIGKTTRYLPMQFGIGISRHKRGTRKACSFSGGCRSAGNVVPIVLEAVHFVCEVHV
jgi:hypothetical protein